jgi:hypothetical protein
MIPPLLSLLLFALLELVVWERLVPPPVRPADAPAEQFSAARARQALERLIPEGEPHPAGSAAQERVRARLIAELERLGLKPEVQTGVACGREGVCAELHNVLAELPGAAPSTTLVSAHYDSVNSGPGAGDDGQGVASLLELARALRTAPAPSGAWLLFSDGEELGLLGARLFAAEHPLMAQLRVSLNLEARGNRGPSLMFQTGEQSGDLVRRYGHAPRPVTSSLFAPVYRALPNDTDFTVFLRKGLRGLNLAFVAGVASYHTPNDTLDRLDWRSVQQQGEAALTTLRGLDSGPSAQPVYFDLLTAVLVTLPEGLMLPLALLGLGCFGASLWSERREPRVLREYGRAALALLLGWGVPLLGTGLLGTLLALLGALPFPVVATPQPFLLSILVLIAGGQALALGICRSPEQRQALGDVIWLCWLGLGTALAASLPAASYLLVLPGFVAGALKLVRQLRRAAPASYGEQLGAALFAGLLVLPLLTLLPGTLELSAPLALAAAWMLGLSPLAPLLAGLLAPARREQRIQVGLFAGVLALAALQLALPPFSSEVPQRLSLVLEANARGDAHWLAEGSSGPLPEALQQAASFAPRPSRPHPWPAYARGLMYVASAPAPSEPLPAPHVRRQGRSLTLEFEAPPDLWALGLRFEAPARIEAARWQGRSVQAVSDADGARLLLVLGAQRSVSVELELEEAGAALPDVLAIALGLPSAGRQLVVGRGQNAVASGFGDMTVLHLEPQLE